MAISNIVESTAELARVSETTERESQLAERDGAISGVRAVPSFGARIAMTLATSARTEATLADLSRTVNFLTGTIGTVRQANASLARELTQLAETHGNAQRERERLVAEHDRFIAMLVADHQHDLDELLRRVAELEEKSAPEKA